ncbi:MAG: S41 family peptidase [Pseudobdellovibrionaceae bacterium]
MRRLFLFLLFIGSLMLGSALNNGARYRDVFRQVCDLTEEHFYRDDEALDQWIKECRYRAARQPLFSSIAQLLRDIQDQLNILNVSHFQVYDPGEDKRLWKGESIDTGIRARYVEEFLIVYRVEKGSAAEEAGVKPGDEILAITGTDQVTPWGAMKRAGEFTIKRADVEKKLIIQPRSLTLNSEPRLEALDSKTALLTMASFRSEFFSKEKWLPIAKQLPKFDHVIVDLRENAGGNFVAMLRALSTFMCSEKYAGRVVQPRKNLPDKKFLIDDLSDAVQIKELESHRNIDLRTYNGYGCYTGKATVLISSDTSSVSEIFASTFFHRPRSRVWGQPSAGDVVLAVWYDLPLLGPGYSFSIPEAEYISPDKEQLEGRGVVPQNELHFDLMIARSGKDEWVEAARR